MERSVWFGNLRISSLLYAYDVVVLLVFSGQELEPAPEQFCSPV